MNYQQQLANSAAIRAEIQRFESVHPNIYSIYELLERVEEPVLQNQIREHVIAIEGVYRWDPCLEGRIGPFSREGTSVGQPACLPRPSLRFLWIQVLP
ncbi:hypothetical protein E5288_WYG006376 [Bos mutus]|uniref:Uncharacterized protein n=1 Tax=Bos mutus TaxID=72004 RepID=A0A6B0QU48_9CETA|nr:hypothetical protein [Bos mutus]